jgi:hypothetical protein
VIALIGADGHGGDPAPGMFARVIGPHQSDGETVAGA